MAPAAGGPPVRRGEEKSSAAADGHITGSGIFFRGAVKTFTNYHHFKKINIKPLHVPFKVSSYLALCMLAKGS